LKGAIIQTVENTARIKVVLLNALGIPVEPDVVAVPALQTATLHNAEKIVLAQDVPIPVKARNAASIANIMGIQILQTWKDAL